MSILLQIEGSAINDIASLYAEINRVFMTGEAWQLGPSLDALDDLLHGGYGALAGQAQATLIWRDIAHSRTALGMETTRQWLQAKLDTPGGFNTEAIARQLQALQQGEGPTYFEIVMQIIASHRQITLVPA
ncbi:barstar family protein [Stenotrophomonas maltophilia]|nr:barstar family protein [Stenotrophomonas maltophilia]